MNSADKILTVGRQERALMLHAYSIANELKINKIIIQACGRHHVDFLREYEVNCRHIWLTRNPESLPIKKNKYHIIIKVPKIATGENFLTLGHFLALLTGAVLINEPVICITAGRSGILNGISVTSTARQLEWLTDDYLEDFVRIDHPQTLVMLINIAMRFSREGREGRRIGTCFILKNKDDISKYSWQLILNPCEGYPKNIRNIFREDFFETLRELSALDGAFLVDPSGKVNAAAVYMATPEHPSQMSPGLGARHSSAAALTAHTDALAVVLSESSGTIIVYGGGKIILKFAR
jgi:hypothetical protein